MAKDIPSTPEATEVAAADQADATTPKLPPAASSGIEGRDFEIDDSVTRPAQGPQNERLPYERKSDDPLYRPLRIFSLDPSASKLEGAEAIVNVPYEPLKPGPIGRVFEITEEDESGPDTHVALVDLELAAAQLNSGRAPSTSDKQFHQQMVYAICATIHAAFRRALGRHVTWGFKLRDPQSSVGYRLRIRPHAFNSRNAYYSRATGELCFGYFKAPEKVQGRTPPGGMVYTCLSHDIVAHEVTHALLDGLRTNFSEPTSADVLGFHEGFADLIAVFQHFSYREVVREAIHRSKGKIESSSLLTGIAHQFGSTLGSIRPLRTAFEDKGQKEPKQYVQDMEEHDLGEILVQAVFEAAITVFRRKTAQYLRLASGGTGRLPEGDLPSDLQSILGDQASKIANNFLSVCIRAIDYCPPVDLKLGEYLRALITADYDLVPDDRWAYREALIDAFRLRGIYPPHVASLSEESLRWPSSDLSDMAIPSLAFKELRFEGDPASPADADELRRQAGVLGKVLSSEHYLKQFGLAKNGNPKLGNDSVDLPRVKSIRSSRRVGPNGQIVFDLVAEVIQQRIVSDAYGQFCFFGGATVIIGPKGEMRYIISKDILDNDRCDRQRKFMNGAGKPYWETSKRISSPHANLFELMHAPPPAKVSSRITLSSSTSASGKQFKPLVWKPYIAGKASKTKFF